MIIFSSGTLKKAVKSRALDTDAGYCAFVDCSKVRIGECPVTCGSTFTHEPHWCKAVDCTKPGASQICPVTCPLAKRDSFTAQMSNPGIIFFHNLYFVCSCIKNDILVNEGIVVFFCLRCRCSCKRLVTSCSIHWIQAQAWQTIQ